MVICLNKLLMVTQEQLLAKVAHLAVVLVKGCLDLGTVHLALHLEIVSKQKLLQQMQTEYYIGNWTT
jgi:hypothetical protein